jgi:hypothetical protein
MIGYEVLNLYQNRFHEQETARNRKAWRQISDTLAGINRIRTVRDPNPVVHYILSHRIHQPWYRLAANFVDS